jgi:hypothetical protein
VTGRRNALRLRYYKSQDIAEWFLRLNGFLTITNFVVHPIFRRGSAQTDGDILGVRFPFRAELRESGEALLDDKMFLEPPRIDFVIAEVKRGACRLNDSWRDPERRIIEYVLNAAGLIHEPMIKQAAAALYRSASYDDGSCRMRMFAFGSERDSNVPATQVVWAETLGFIYRRFLEHRLRKSDHDQWGEVGGALFDHATNYSDDEEHFVSELLARMT